VDFTGYDGQPMYRATADGPQCAQCGRMNGEHQIGCPNSDSDTEARPAGRHRIDFGADLNDAGALAPLTASELARLAQKLTEAAAACQYEAGKRSALRHSHISSCACRKEEKRQEYEAISAETTSAFLDVIDELASSRARLAATIGT
jgi:hypothetical protein